MAFQFGNVFLLFITTCVLARLLFFFFLYMSAAVQIGFAFGFWTHSLEMDEWSGFSWFKPGM